MHIILGERREKLALYRVLERRYYGPNSGKGPLKKLDWHIVELLTYRSYAEKIFRRTLLRRWGLFFETWLRYAPYRSPEIVGFDLR